MSNEINLNGGKNIIVGGKIVTGGSFHLGDHNIDGSADKIGGRIVIGDKILNGSNGSQIVSNNGVIQSQITIGDFSLTVKDGKVYDEKGKDVTERYLVKDSPTINIIIGADFKLGDIKIINANNVTVGGGVGGSLTVQNCAKVNAQNVGGNVTTHNGDIKCGSVSGDAKAFNGNVNIGDAKFS